MTLGSSPLLNLGAIQLPIMDFAIQGNAILGIKESGKSYTGTGIAEQFFDAGIPWICFDQVGIWRWLRVAGSGAGARAYPIVIAGGRSADLPLTIDNAPTIVRTAMRENQCLIVDTFDPEISKTSMRRIVRECCELLLHENPEHGLRHVFFEEAADIVPQRVMGEMAKTFSAVEELARKGGNSQLGFTLISTRPEDINKSILELCDALLLHRQKGKHSILGLRKWLTAADAGMADEIGRSLGTLGPGQCWIWARESTTPTLTQIPHKRSHHPDRRQQSGQTREIGALPQSATGLNEFLRAMRQTLKKSVTPSAQPVQPQAGHSDPARDRAPRGLRSPEGQRDIDIRQPARAEAEGFEKGRIAGFREGQQKTLTRAQELIADASRTCSALLEQLQQISTRLAIEIEPLITIHASGGPISPRTMKALGEVAMRAADYIQPRIPAGRPALEPGQKDAAALRILRVLAERHPARFTLKQWATLCGMSSTGGTWRTYTRYLVSCEFIVLDGREVGCTPAGILAAGVSPRAQPQSRQELLADWKQKLGEGCGRMLDLIVRNFEVQFSTEHMADELQMSAAGGTFRGYLGKLVRNNLVEKKGNRYQAAEIFRQPARR